ncbi:MAG: AAA ATPase [Candidatus Magnetoglobus multicellularis str. Araruama]|uniref:AAA ATPase n=1 Tax=Candidatus Magnetoglobus multicellularis str. Araruama TaxID=890399 RepID=A0A1V1P6D6_9BACT|nr:MAG: AAA ATPase [Candidatus Magnetoglobus multicellularis str. Araruama]
MNYPFQLIDYRKKGTIKNPKILEERPFTQFDSTFAEDAKLFISGEELDTAINTSIAVGEPLLITGEPGTGKTQTAYYAAFKLGVEPVLHFQVKSDTTARDLLYHFDAVQYFHDAAIKSKNKLNKADYIEERPLWEAMESDHPRVLLIDEIDKASRDFPNDLLHELDKMEFTITETEQLISSSLSMRPMVFITSNSERRLPEPFLRRCVYHHIEFDSRVLEKAIQNRMHEFKGLSDDFIQMALERFLTLRSKALRKVPATGEFLVWLRVLAMTADLNPRRLEEDLSKLPYLGVLLKDHQDVRDITV